jgi:hypothetical protein
MSIGSFLSGPELYKPEHLAAVSALEATATPSRTAACVLAPKNEAWATDTYGPVKPKVSWWGWLRRKPVARSWLAGNAGLPGDDHVEYREKDGKRVRISQPYQIRWDDLQALVRHCQENDLEASIHGSSWWFPDRTVVVVMRPKEIRT